MRQQLVELQDAGPPDDNAAQPSPKKHVWTLLALRPTLRDLASEEQQEASAVTLSLLVQGLAQQRKIEAERRTEVESQEVTCQGPVPRRNWGACRSGQTLAAIFAAGGFFVSQSGAHVCKHDS